MMAMPRSASWFWMRIHRILVARNGARGEDDAVAPVEFHHRMLALGDARERGHRLALAAGHECGDLIARYGAETVLIEIGEMLGPKPGVTGGFHDAVHGAADQHQLAACARAASAMAVSRFTFDAKVVIAIRPFARAMTAFRFSPTACLGGACAVDQRIGAVADEHVHAFVAEPRELGLVGRIAKARRVVELPVAGMKHVAAGVRRRRALPSGIECETVRGRRRTARY